jgi:hypothetical protein
LLPSSNRFHEAETVEELSLFVPEAFWQSEMNLASHRARVKGHLGEEHFPEIESSYAFAEFQVAQVRMTSTL